MNTKDNSGIIIFGNPSTKGLAAELTKELRADCFGRAKDGLDLKIKKCRQEFIERSFSYDTVILCSYAKEFSQVVLLQELYLAWSLREKRGRILAIGCSCDRYLKAKSVEASWFTISVEKEALKNQMRIINANNIDKNIAITATYISPHHIDTENYKYDHALSVMQVAQTVKWVLSQNFLIEEICLRNM